MKIVILDGYTANPGDLSWEKLEQFGEIKVYDRTPQEKIVERIQGYDIVLVNKTPITRETIFSSDTLKFIGVLATGYNIVDVKAAREKNIPVANVPGYSTESVAQLTFAFILELTHHVGDHSQGVHNGKWINSKDFCYWDYPLLELNGKTLGIIGYGAIGQKVGEIAKAFGMNLLVCSNHKRAELEDDKTRYTDYDEIFKKSDFITLHCPLFPETKNLIRKENIEKMKDGVFIINTSRGPVINEVDLRQALETGKVGGAAVDVISSEPMKNDNPLYKAPNCFITPHIAWAPYEARIRLIDITKKNIQAFIENKPINVVN